MYNFRDTIDHSTITPAKPAEAVKINGQYLEDAVTGYRTLYTKGRESLGAELSIYETGMANGSVVKGRKYPPRKITVGFQLIAEDPIMFRFLFGQLNNLLSLDRADFVFDDDSGFYYTGTPIFNAEVDEGQISVKGEWEIYCAYPFKRSIETTTLTMEDAQVTDTSATFVIDYKGGIPAKPLLRASFAGAKSGGESSEDGDCGFVAFMDENENIIQLGNPDALDLDDYTRASTLINRVFSDTTGWASSGGSAWHNRPITDVIGDNFPITDTYWDKGKGQTQKYAKAVYTTTSGWHGALLRKSVETSANFTLQAVHRLCVQNANERGTCEIGAKKSDGTILAGIVIDKTSNGTTGVVYYIIDGEAVGQDNIDLSYYNTNFGYCKRSPVYVYQTYTVKYLAPKDVTVPVTPNAGTLNSAKRKTKIVRTETRKVRDGWSYTQSNLNTKIVKNGNYIKFTVGNLSPRTFYTPALSVIPANSVSLYMGAYGNTPMNTNAIHSVLFRREAGVPFAEQPNVFTAEDIVEADCNDASVRLYRNGSAEGAVAPQFGALGNDWESFKLDVGTNVIRATWSDWVDPTYKPQIEIEYNEVFL